jgi:hypothetical protein
VEGNRARRRVVAAEETGVDGGGGDQRRERRRGDRAAGTLELFGMKVKRHEADYYLYAQTYLKRFLN